MKKLGRGAIEKLLPATITGPVAMVIGLTLAGNALSDAAVVPVIPDPQAALAANMAWVISW